MYREGSDPWGQTPSDRFSIKTPIAPSFPHLVPNYMVIDISAA
jgi:hypothetical protein